MSLALTIDSFNNGIIDWVNTPKHTPLLFELDADVFEFNAVAGHTLDFSLVSFQEMVKAIEKQRWIVGLEWRELIDDGIKAKNLEEVLDGLCDVVYTGIWLERQCKEVIKVLINLSDLAMLDKPYWAGQKNSDVRFLDISSKGEATQALMGSLTKSLVLLLQAKPLVMYLIEVFGFNTFEQAMVRVVKANKAKYFTKKEDLLNAGKDDDTWEVRQSLGSGRTCYCWVDSRGKMKKPSNWVASTIGDLILTKHEAAFLEIYHV